MNIKKQRNALTKAIEHWHENLDMLLLNNLSKAEDLREDIYIGPKYCPLCRINRSCKNCLIGIETQREDCEGSPFFDVYYWYYRTTRIPNYTRADDFNRGWESITGQLEYLYMLKDRLDTSGHI